MKKLLATIATTAAVVTLSAAPAHAVTDVIMFQQAGTTKCFNAPSYYSVGLATCNPADTRQQWSVNYYRYPRVYPKNVYTGRCLEQYAEARVQLNTCGPTNNQTWYRNSSTFSYTLRTEPADKCIDPTSINGLTLNPCTAASTRWNEVVLVRG
ncbi:ricin-type beta-trefoil lectin domain protein [Lentzea sp. NPDC006480]|uniref:RICIN domain-containing protein n=1 Tax=Lentzea sp. NPDC006480 TaxID=3157176 RepID=UPI0033B18B63